MSFIETIGGQIAGAGMGMLLGGANDKRQLSQQQKLNNQQVKANAQMTEIQRKSQMQMWHDTNYSAQMKELEKAGLNPALLYGMSGGGGTTAGAGGASVNAPNAPSGGGEAMGLMTQANMALITAQVEKIKAETKNIQSETPTNGNLGDAEIGAKEAGARLANVNADIAEIQKRVNESTEQDMVNMVRRTVAKIDEEGIKLRQENRITGENLDALIKGKAAEALQPALQNALIKSNIGVNDAEISKWSAEIAGMWKNLSIQEQNMFVNKINAGTNMKNADANTDNASTNKLMYELQNRINDITKEQEAGIKIIGNVLGAAVLKGAGGGVPRTPVTGFKR